MFGPHRLCAVALIVCFASVPTTPIFANEAPPTRPASPVDHVSVATMPLSAAIPAVGARSRFAVRDEVLRATAPSAFAAAAQRGGYRGRRPRGGRVGPAAAMAVGAIASITGAAILVYANRPECVGNAAGRGCGYGTKVVGGAVLTGGIVGLAIGASAWR